MTTHKTTRARKEVCDLLVLGMSNKEIARELGISARTVEDHRLQAFKDYGVRNVVELTRLFLTSAEGAEHAEAEATV